MGRTRTDNIHLPRRMYKDKKSGTYYFKDGAGKNHNLGKVFYSAFALYRGLVPDNTKIVSMADLIDKYMAEKSPLKAKTTHTDELKSAKQLKTAFGHFFPCEVTPADVGIYIEHRSKEAGVRPNRELSLLSEIFKQAPRWGINTTNPTRDVKRNPETAARKAKRGERYVTDEQLIEFMRHCPVWLRLYLELKQLTGMRQSRMLSLTVFNIKPEGLFIDTVGKRGDALTFEWSKDLSDVIGRVLAYSRLVGSEYLFPNKDGSQRGAESFKSAWARTRDKALQNGLEKGFAERYIRNKSVTDCEDKHQASKTVGHKSFKTTMDNYNMLGHKVVPFTKKV